MEDAGDTRWVRSTFRLLFAGLAALTAYAHAQQHWALAGALFALGAIATLTLQAELDSWMSSRRGRSQRTGRASAHAVSLQECRPRDIFESWMNEYPLHYDPKTFSWSRTQPVYVRLEESVLNVWSTTVKVPRKATWNEPPLRKTAPLSQHREYDLKAEGCRVKLLPDDLPRKKMWSRKYPICVTINHCRKLQEAEGAPLGPCTSDVSLERTSYHADDDEIVPLISPDSNSEVETLEDTEAQILERIVSQELIDELVEDDDVADDTQAIMLCESSLLFFARSSRQKEEWYRRLRRALGHPCPLDDDEVFGDYVASVTPYLTDGRPNQGLNALIGRIMYGMTHSTRLRAAIREGIQKKLSALNMPVLMEKPVVDDVVFQAVCLEVIHTGLPKLDVKGLWVDIEVSYRGVFRISVTTKLNLLHEKQAQDSGSEQEQDTCGEGESNQREEREEEEEEVVEGAKVEATTQEQSTRARAKQNWQSFMKKLSESRYFHAAITALSNTNIVLSVEVKSVHGVLAVNVPPPPSDRLWFGFRGVPSVRMEAVPRIGSRALRHSLVCRLIVLKLRSLLERAFVLPNMQNMLLSFMGGEDEGDLDQDL